jgi:hypothetical protein
MRISKKLLEKKKMKKGKPWNNTVLLSAQDLTLRGLAARGRLQAQRPHGPAARARARGHGHRPQCIDRGAVIGGGPACKAARQRRLQHRWALWSTPGTTSGGGAQWGGGPLTRGRRVVASGVPPLTGSHGDERWACSKGRQWQSLRARENEGGEEKGLPHGGEEMGEGV